MRKPNHLNIFKLVKTTILINVLTIFISHSASSQNQVPLTNLDFFHNPGKSWDIVGEVSADINQEGKLTASKGEGILANIPTKKTRGTDLYTQSEYGDMDMEVDFLIAKGSNSGIYIQGMYEIQIMDSWGVVNPRPGDNGGIYERYDESKPQGQKGYQGYAPRYNVSRAPGLWQNMKVSFQAPKFDQSGNKIENAKILSIILNGIMVHEDVELFGPTRGAMAQKEKERGPIRIQGDHGAVAFRNFKIAGYDKMKPEIKDLRYSLYDGRYEEEPDYTALTAYSEGSLETLTSNLRAKSKQYLIRYRGNVLISEPGEYTVNFNTSGGGGLLKIDGNEVYALGQPQRSKKVNLSAGSHPFELVYSKIQDWIEPGLGLSLEGPGIRETQLSKSVPQGKDATDPILVDPKEISVLRSFMDLPNSPRVTHAISVGSENNVHYTYDLDNGSIIQLWRGKFLDATPMWNSRGDGSSRPMGTVVYFGEPSLAILKLKPDGSEWAKDTATINFKPKGYKINGKDNHVAFLYQIHGASVEDDIEIMDTGHGIKRTVKIQNISNGLHYRIAQGDQIQELEKGLYLIDDKTYYLRIEGNQKPTIRTVSGKKELVVPATELLNYSILF